jgi:hypothetical protein
MKNTSALAFVLQAALAAFLGAVVATLVVTLVILPSSADRSSEARSAPVAGRAHSEAQLLARVEELQDANRSLRDRLTALEQRPEPAAREPVGDFVPRGDFAAFEQEVRAWMVGQPLAVKGALALADEPELREEVAVALKTIRKDEAVTSALKKNENEAARLEERVTRMSDWLTLDEYQAGELRTLMSTKDEQDRQLIRRWEDGVDDEVLGETKRANTLALHDELERVLSPDQFETFRSKFPRPRDRD